MIVLLAGLLAVVARAVPPETYFASAYGLTGSALKTQLNSIISGHTVLTYTPGVWEAHKDLYEDPNNPNNIILFYSQASISKALQDSGSSPNTYWNREHLWPNSYGIDDSTSRGYTDIFHLVPAYKGVNSSRGNKWFDGVNPGDPGYTFPAHPLAPLCATNTDAWEPADGQKSWASRAMLYMTTRYPTLQLVDTPPSAAPDANASRMAQLSVMLDWNRRFPATAKDKYLNQRIYDDYQHNRNPYIDFPEFADAIWVTGPSWGGWRLDHFTLAELLDPAVSGDLADPDKDNLVNLVEMALYTDPRAANSTPPLQESVSGSNLTLIFIRAKSPQNLNLTLTLESSTNLTSWSTVSLAGANVSSIDTKRESVTVTKPMPASGPVFYRLSAARP